MSRWRLFTDRELQVLNEMLDDYCDRYEDTCEEQEKLANELDDERKRRWSAARAARKE